MMNHAVECVRVSESVTVVVSPIRQVHILYPIPQIGLMLIRSALANANIWSSKQQHQILIGTNSVAKGVKQVITLRDI